MNGGRSRPVALVGPKEQTPPPQADRLYLVRVLEVAWSARSLASLGTMGRRSPVSTAALATRPVEFPRSMR